MTIAGRNRVLILGICITGIVLVGTIYGCVTVFAQKLLVSFPVSVQNPLWLLRQQLFVYNNYAKMIGIVSFPLIALFILITTFVLFEKTHALEISFFSWFVFSLSVEALQLLFPLQKLYPLLTVFFAPLARVILFFRFCACLSLLTSSLFAHKTFTRQTWTIIFLLSFMSFSLAHTIPVNTADTPSFLLFSQSYLYLLYSFNGIICLLAVLSFLFVGIYRSIPEYRHAALWLLTALAAYALLLHTGSWFFIAIGIAALTLGLFFFTRAIHRFYLWQ